MQQTIVVSWRGKYTSRHHHHWACGCNYNKHHQAPLNNNNKAKYFPLLWRLLLWNEARKELRVKCVTSSQQLLSTTSKRVCYLLLISHKCIRTFVVPVPSGVQSNCLRGREGEMRVPKCIKLYFQQCHPLKSLERLHQCYLNTL